MSVILQTNYRSLSDHSSTRDSLPLEINHKNTNSIGNALDQYLNFLPFERIIRWVGKDLN